ncbi:MAG: hypothetical protein ACJ78Q_10630 [Chloroflexia bacterium]
MDEQNRGSSGSGSEDFTMASASMPDRGTDASPMGLDEALGAAHRDASSHTTQEDWSATYGRVDTALPNDGPLTADYEDLENPGTTTLDEEFAASGDS